MKQTARLKQLRTRFPDLEFQDYYCASIDVFVESARCCPKKDMARCLVSYVLGRAFEDMSMAVWIFMAFIADSQLKLLLILLIAKNLMSIYYSIKQTKKTKLSTNSILSRKKNYMTAVVLFPDQQSRGLDDPNEEG